MPGGARRTAPHIALLTRRKGPGGGCKADGGCTATGLAKRYDPPPKTAMPCRSGSASLTPSAAPAPQPSPAAGLDPKNPPGRVDGQCSGKRVYSLTIAEPGSRASARQALTQTGLIGRIVFASSRILRQPA